VGSEMCIRDRDGGDRKFVLVQLPEPTDNPKYKTIANICKERIRRVIEKLCKDQQIELKDSQRSEDLGFKAFRLSEPNIQRWSVEEERDPEPYGQKLVLFNDPLVSGWKAENVIWEVALREGFSLNTRFTIRELRNGNKVYDVIDPDTAQQFLICLDDQIRADLIKQCELTPQGLFVCRDLALDDSAAANLALQCRLKTI